MATQVKGVATLQQLIAAIAVLATLSLAACGGSSGDSDTDTDIISADETDGPIPPEEPEDLIPEPVVSVEALAIDQTDAAGIIELLTYRMPAVNGGVTIANAVVLIPQGEVPPGGFPVVAWGHRATGVSDSCAPSVSADLRGTSAYLNQLVENGYAVVAADYEGLGTEDAHPYLHLASGGRSLLYAVNAAVAEYESLSSRYAVLGHSQGGHAALGAGELAGELRDIELTGVAAIAPPSQLMEQSLTLNAVISDTGRSLADRAQAAGVILINSALLAKGVEALNPQFAIDSVFGSNGSTLLNSLESECIPELIGTLLAPITGALFISGSVDSIVSDAVTEVPFVQQYLNDLEPGRVATAVPVQLMQGLLDETVLSQSTAALGNLLGSVNTLPPTLIEYPSADHTTVLDQSFDDVLAFLATVFAVE